MTIETTVKKWGNSLAVTLPMDMVKQKRIKANDKILLEVVKKSDIKDIFGSLKRKMTGQEFKDMVREGWK